MRSAALICLLASSLPKSWEVGLCLLNERVDLIQFADDDDDDDDDDGIQKQEQKDFLPLIALLFLCRFLYLFASW